MSEMVLVDSDTMNAINRGEYKPHDLFSFCVLMLANDSTLRAYVMGLNWGEERIKEAREILVKGKASRYWTSTRLLLGLSEEEANKAAKFLA